MKETEIKTIACVGAGLIGYSWSVVFAVSGLSVILQDVKDTILIDSLNHVKSSLTFLAEKGLIEKEESEAALDRVETTTSIKKAVEAADYVQESAPETYEFKKALFREMDVIAPESTVLASSSSALLMTEIQKATNNPQRCVLVHPWNPPHLMPLVEIAGGERTSKETINAACHLMTRVGKIPVILKKEAPGYIANRIQAAVLREAIDIVDKGIANVEDVDKAVSLGPALRWVVLGPFLNHHIGGKGIERFIETLGASYALRWSTMATWTMIPPEAASKVIKGVYETEVCRTMSSDEIAEWRDNKLVELLKIIQLPKTLK